MNSPDDADLGKKDALVAVNIAINKILQFNLNQIK